MCTVQGEQNEPIPSFYIDVLVEAIVKLMVRLDIFVAVLPSDYSQLAPWEC